MKTLVWIGGSCFNEPELCKVIRFYISSNTQLASISFQYFFCYFKDLPQNGTTTQNPYQTYEGNPISPQLHYFNLIFVTCSLQFVGQ